MSERGRDVCGWAAALVLLLASEVTHQLVGTAYSLAPSVHLLGHVLGCAQALDPRRAGTLADDRVRCQLAYALQYLQLTLRRPVRRWKMCRQDAHEGSAARNERSRLHGTESRPDRDDAARRKLRIEQHVGDDDGA